MELPATSRFLRRLASFSRLITFDRRGWGGSDLVSRRELSPWEDWADDVRAVLDAVESERAAVLGMMDVAPTAILFAATEPDRTRALILYNASARLLPDDGYPGVVPESEVGNIVTFMREIWGTEALADPSCPSIVGDRATRTWFARSSRAAASPRVAAEYFRLALEMDVRDALPSVRVPTLVIHRKDYGLIPVEHGRYIAEHVPDGRLVLVPGPDAAWFIEPTGEILDAVEEFLTGARPAVEPDRILATVLFTDIVGSTERAAALGDRRWKQLLESHDAVTRTVLDQFRGRLVKTTGDGVLATFDGPGRAIRAAVALQESLRGLGVEIRAGVHTGELELRGEDVGGIAVHIGARVMAHARAGEVVVSGAVPPLVAGSGIEFEDRGAHELKGVPGEWTLFAVRT